MSEHAFCLLSPESAERLARQIFGRAEPEPSQPSPADLLERGFPFTSEPVR